MNMKTKDLNPTEIEISVDDMVELKRDMQSAHVAAWLQKNQQQLIAGVLVFVVVLIGLALWKEQRVAQREAAALAYLQATNSQDEAERNALLAAVVSEYPDSGYAVLADMQQGKAADIQTRTTHLLALTEHQGGPEIQWQARLDLAELYIAQGNADQAKALLDKRMGKHYEQARFFLLSQVATDSAEKMTLIQKSLDAETHDNDLVARLEADLATLKAAQ